jgi:hypothetical protein
MTASRPEGCTVRLRRLHDGALLHARQSAERLERNHDGIRAQRALPRADDLPLDRVPRIGHVRTIVLLASACSIAASLAARARRPIAHRDPA